MHMNIKRDPERVRELILGAFDSIRDLVAFCVCGDPNPVPPGKKYDIADCMRTFGNSRSWWIKHAPNIPGSSKATGTWQFPIDEARKYFESKFG